jgi:hypothetical protein
MSIDLAARDSCKCLPAAYQPDTKVDRATSHRDVLDVSSFENCRKKRKKKKQRLRVSPSESEEKSRRHWSSVTGDWFGVLEW